MVNFSERSIAGVTGGKSDYNSSAITDIKLQSCILKSRMLQQVLYVTDQLMKDVEYTASTP
jgi:hypothetical protein